MRASNLIDQGTKLYCGQNLFWNKHIIYALTTGTVLWDNSDLNAKSTSNFWLLQHWVMCIASI